MLVVQEIHRLGRNMLEGLIVLNDLFDRSVAVKVLSGTASGEYTERNVVLDIALALAEDRRRDIVRKTKNGLEALASAGRSAADHASSTKTARQQSWLDARKVSRCG